LQQNLHRTEGSNDKTALPTQNKHCMEEAVEK